MVTNLLSKELIFPQNLRALALAFQLHFFVLKRIVFRKLE